jgi:hypothetical protein
MLAAGQHGPPMLPIRHNRPKSGAEAEPPPPPALTAARTG